MYWFMSHTACMFLCDKCWRSRDRLNWSAQSWRDCLFSFRIDPQPHPIPGDCNANTWIMSLFSKFYNFRRSWTPFWQLRRTVFRLKNWNRCIISQMLTKVEMSTTKIFATWSPMAKRRNKKKLINKKFQKKNYQKFFFIKFLSALSNPVFLHRF